jgi:hypothetical protein
MSGLARVIWSHGALVALAWWTLGAISSCGGESSDPSRSVMATISIDCSKADYSSIFQGGVQVQTVRVGDSIRCRIRLQEMPTEAEEGLDEVPPNHNYEWAFSSDDGGSIYFADRRGIEWDPSPRFIGNDSTRAACEGPGGMRSVTVLRKYECNTVCCEHEDGSHELVMSKICDDAMGHSVPIHRCPGKSQTMPVCCELPVAYPNATGPTNASFVAGRQQITDLSTCNNYSACTAACGVAPVIEFGERYDPGCLGGFCSVDDYQVGCSCCRLADGSLASVTGALGGQVTNCEELGGEIVDREECWRYPGPCGKDHACGLSFCVFPPGAGRPTELMRFDLCIEEGGSPEGQEYQGEGIGCCQDEDTGEVFAVRSNAVEWVVDATTEAWFVAVSPGTVTIRMRQLIAPPILFGEESPGSSLLELRIDEGCAPPAFDISGTFSERYNCAEGSDCVDQDQVAGIVITSTSDSSTFDFADELDPDTWSGSGRLCGTSFEWAARSNTYQETGTWTFSDASNFNKVSDYSYFDGGGGTCTGEGSSSMSPPAPAPIPPACP